MSAFRIYSERGDYGRAMKLAIMIEDGVGGVTEVAAPLEFKVAGEGYAPLPYTVDRAEVRQRTDGAGNVHRSVLDGRALIQAFMDHGWEIGVRPTGVSDVDTTRQVAAMTRHLEDMRTLVFTANGRSGFGQDPTK